MLWTQRHATRALAQDGAPGPRRTPRRAVRSAFARTPPSAVPVDDSPSATRGPRLARDALSDGGAGKPAGSGGGGGGIGGRRSARRRLLLRFGSKPLTFWQQVSAQDARLHGAWRRWAHTAASRTEHADTAARAVAAFATWQRYRASQLRKGWARWHARWMVFALRRHAAAGKGPSSGHGPLDGPLEVDHEPARLQSENLQSEMAQLRAELENVQREGQKATSFLERMRAERERQVREAEQQRRRPALLQPQPLNVMPGAPLPQLSSSALMGSGASWGEYQAQLKSAAELHRRLEGERQRYAGFASDLHSFATRMHLSEEGSPRTAPCQTSDGSAPIALGVPPAARWGLSETHLRAELGPPPVGPTVAAHSGLWHYQPRSSVLRL